MEREWRVKVEETNHLGMTVATHQRHREVGDRKTQHVLGEMLGDAIVSMAADDAANVLQALIRRLDLLGDNSIRPFSELASCWRAWDVCDGDKDFSECVVVESVE